MNLMDKDGIELKCPWIVLALTVPDPTAATDLVLGTGNNFSADLSSSCL